MQKTSNVTACVEPEIKIRQVIIQRGIPFDIKLPHQKPVAIGAITYADLNIELEKGCADIAAGRLHSLDDVVAELHDDYGV